MYIVILGASKVGIQLARQLILEKNNVALIEKNSEKAKDASNRLDCLVINNMGNSLEALKKAGIEKADVFVSVSDSDETNLISCGLVHSEFENVTTIARVRNTDYSKTKMLSKSFLGIDYVINPEIEAAKIMGYTLNHGAYSDIMLFENSKFQMRNLKLGNKSSLINKDLKTIKQEKQFPFLVAAVIRKEKFIIPSGDTILLENDQIYFLSTEEGFEIIFQEEYKGRKEINKILIIGGSHISSYLIDQLLQEDNFAANLENNPFKKLFQRNKKNITIIEKDYNRCQELSQAYPQILVTHADVTEDNFQEEEMIKDYDIVISATNNQELNIVTSIYAKSLGIKKAMALVIRNSYRTMAHNLNVDVTVGLNDAVVNSILKRIRRGNIKNVHALSGSQLEVIEYHIEQNSPILGKKISQIKLPPKSLIIFLSKEGKEIIPNGDTTIDTGDNLVMILEKESIIKVEKIIAG